MRHLGSILVSGTDSVDDRDLCVRLRVNGYDARHVHSLDATLSSFAQEHHDLVLLLVDNTEKLRALVLALRAAEGGKTVPICVAAKSSDLTAALQVQAADCDDFIVPPLYDGKLVAHLRPLLRLATMRTELRIRAASAKRFGVSVSPEPTDTKMNDPINALIVGDIAGARGAFAELRMEEIADPGLAVDTLHGRQFDLAILVPGTDAPTYLDLCRRIRASPSLFNLPVAVVAQSDERIEEASYNSGASVYFDASSDDRAMLPQVRALVRRQRARLYLSRALAATLTDKTRGISRAYSSAFLEEYLPERFDFAQRFGRQLTVLRIHSADVEAIRKRFGDIQADDLQRALEQWTAQLTRVEDLLAVSEEGAFVMVLPDTPQAEASAVASRIAGVVSQVEFALTEVYEGIRAYVVVNGAVLRPGDTLPDFLNRVRNETI